MYHRPLIGCGHGHGYPRHELVPTHPHRAMINDDAPHFWLPRAHAPPFPAAGPRNGELAAQQQPHHHHHHYHHHYHLGPAETPRRDPPVEVRLPRGPVYLCDGADLRAHFPNVRHRLIGRVLRVEDFIAGVNRTVLTEDALHHVFRAFELRRIAGLSVDLFERERDLLRNNNNGGEFFGCAFDLFVGTCQALDSECGLGCSDDLAVQVGEFAVELKAEADLGLWNYHTLEALFAAYSKVFRPGVRRHMDALRELWRAIDIDLKARLVAELGRELALHPHRSNVNAMYHALGDMDML